LLTTDEQQYIRLQEALDSINSGLEANPDDSTVHAVRAFVLDWNANPALVGDEWTSLLTESEQEAIHALALDNQNTLALAYYAEILVDSQQLIQAEQYINQAMERDPGLMDVHRVNGYVRESLGYYGDAIRAYQEAVEITPNLTFLYIRIGVNYRQLKQYELALEYFAKAANINEQLGVQDPLPYLAIGKTYSQMGEFFVAAQNVRKVLEFDPTNPDIYGTLGMIYFKSRNYEGAIPALKCSTYGCSPEESCLARIGDPEYCADPANIVDSPAISGMALTTSTVVYYYTYGSVLAGMHRPYNNYCELSLDVMQEVRSEFSGEPVIIQIVEASEEICASFGITN
jgi:tetratricopeptide (TPR) repeat protein